MPAELMKVTVIGNPGPNTDLFLNEIRQKRFCFNVYDVGSNVENDYFKRHVLPKRKPGVFIHCVELDGHDTNLSPGLINKLKALTDDPILVVGITKETSDNDTQIDKIKCRRAQLAAEKIQITNDFIVKLHSKQAIDTLCKRIQQVSPRKKIPCTVVTVNPQPIATSKDNKETFTDAALLVKQNLQALELAKKRGVFAAIDQLHSALQGTNYLLTNEMREAFITTCDSILRQESSKPISPMLVKIMIGVVAGIVLGALTGYISLSLLGFPMLELVGSIVLASSSAFGGVLGGALCGFFSKKQPTINTYDDERRQLNAFIQDIVPAP